MSVRLKIEGAGDIERALEKLSRVAAKGVMRRAMKKALQPVAEAAEASPFPIAISGTLSPRQRRLARKDRGPNLISLYVGPVQSDGSHAPHAHLYEFGTGPRYQVKTGKYVGVQMADPFMRPAWDENRDAMLKILRREVWIEIEKTLARAARKAAKAG